MVICSAIQLLKDFKKIGEHHVEALQKILKRITESTQMQKWNYVLIKFCDYCLITYRFYLMKFRFYSRKDKPMVA